MDTIMIADIILIMIGNTIEKVEPILGSEVLLKHYQFSIGK